MNRYEALKHAVKAHAGQTDKCGQPYILHPIAVAEAIEAADFLGKEETVSVALLHDVFEDRTYPLSLGMTRRETMALQLLTHHPPDTYAQYIDAICLTTYIDVREMAARVKLADLWHNLQPERQACLPSKEAASLEKRYLKARDRIWEALGYEWWPSGETGR